MEMGGRSEAFAARFRCHVSAASSPYTFMTHSARGEIENSIPGVACAEFPDDPFIIIDAHPLEPGDPGYDQRSSKLCRGGCSIHCRKERASHDGGGKRGAKKRKRMIESESDSEGEDQDWENYIRPGDLWKSCCINHERVMRPQDCQLLGRYFAGVPMDVGRECESSLRVSFRRIVANVSSLATKMGGQRHKRRRK